MQPSTMRMPTKLATPRSSVVPSRWRGRVSMLPRARDRFSLVPAADDADAARVERDRQGARRGRRNREDRTVEIGGDGRSVPSVGHDPHQLVAGREERAAVDQRQIIRRTRADNRTSGVQKIVWLERPVHWRDRDRSAAAAKEMFKALIQGR